MPQINRPWLGLLSWSAALVWAAITFEPTMAIAEGDNEDPVAALTKALQFQIANPNDPVLLEARKKSLMKHIQALRNAGELRDALQLHEWRDLDANQEIATIDRQIRDTVAKRLEETIRRALRGKDDIKPLAAVHFLGEIGFDVRSTGTNRYFAGGLAPDLIALLKENDSALREAAARTLGKVNADHRVAVPALDGVLRTGKTASERQAAAEGLDNLIQAATQVLKLQNVEGYQVPRSEQIQIVNSAVLKVGGGFADPDAQVRRHCAEAIRSAAVFLTGIVPFTQVREEEPPGRQSTDEGSRAEFLPLVKSLNGQIPALTKVASEEDLAASLAANEALEAIAESRLRWLAIAGNARDYPPADLREAAKNLGKNLARKEKSFRARLASLYVLETLETGKGEAVPAAQTLVASLQDADPFIRWGAVRALGKMPALEAEKANAVPELARLLNDENGDVRITAAAALERYGPVAKTAVSALAKTVQRQEDAQTQIAAIRALAAMRKEARPAAPELAKALTAKNTDIRFASAKALAKVGPLDASSVAALRKALADPEAKVRQAASDALLMEW